MKIRLSVFKKIKTPIKKVLFLALIAILATSCYTVYKVMPQKYNYTENIVFKIEKIEEGVSIATGDFAKTPPRGHKFVFIQMTFKNKTNKKLDLNFDNFALLNPKTKTKHKVELVMVIAPVNVFGRIDSYIGKNAEKQRKLVFAFPENDKAKILMVNDEVVEIKYAQ